MTHFRNATRDINDPNCGLPIDTIAENVFVNCFEFRVGEPSVELSIEIPEPKEVWPTLRTRDGGNPNERNELLFNILVTNGIDSIPNYELDIEIEFADSSGGHQHSDPGYPNNLRGTLTDSLTNQSQVGSIITSSNQNGLIFLKYISNQSSGKFIITARSTSESLSISDTITVKVPNLLQFGEIGSYTLTGETINHVNNHYLINQQAINSLLGASSAFGNSKWNTSGEMRLNDMSLEWGGLFDISGQWRTPHNSHRTGRDVDIENISARDTTLMVLDPVTGIIRERTVLVFESDWIENYRVLMQLRNWFFVDEGQNNPNRNPINDQPGIRYPHFNWRGN